MPPPLSLSQPNIHLSIDSSINTAEDDPYLSAGVNIEEGNKVIKEITPYVKETYNDCVLNSIGCFGGCYNIKDINEIYDEPILVSSIDGVGTKSILSIKHQGLQGFYNLGNDIVNHCVNDVLVQGAKPLYFLDYFASSHIDSNEVKEFVRGISDACKKCNCVLIGGETAEMPTIYNDNMHDFVGCMTGVVDKRNIINGKKTIKENDMLIGLPSSGPHTNGYSLIRSLIKEHPDDFDDALMNKLCVPHKSYLTEIECLINNNIPIHGLCHITGGGFDDNINRIMPTDKCVVYNTFEYSELFKQLQTIGNLTDKTMKQVFNCGYGMIIVVPCNIYNEVEKLLPECVQIGYIKNKGE